MVEQGGHEDMVLPSARDCANDTRTTILGLGGVEFKEKGIDDSIQGWC